MAGWSHLPGELLELIAYRLEDSVDLLRFRSVCNSWRGSVPAELPTLPSRFPILPTDGISGFEGGLHVYKRTIYRLALLHDPQNWILKVQEHCGGGSRSPTPRIHLFHPLYGPKLNLSSPSFPPTPMDLSQIRLSKLGHEYVFQYVNTPIFPGDASVANLFMEKAVLANHPDGSIAVLTIHVSGKLFVVNSGDKNWSVIDDLPSPYDDVILFHARFYAVDCTGRIVTVDLHPQSPPRVLLIAGPVFGGDKKWLVECGQQLLLVDIYLIIGPAGEEDEEEDAGDNGLTSVMGERVVGFKIYRLDWRQQNWVEVKNLGDRLLFLGDNCTFSASASDFPGSRGNCIIFRDNYLSLGRGKGISMFSLDDGKVYSLANHMAYSALFWPPADLVLSTSSHGQL